MLIHEMRPGPHPLLRQLREYLLVYDDYPWDHSDAVRHLIRLMEQGTSVLDDRRLLKPEFARLVFQSSTSTTSWPGE